MVESGDGPCFTLESHPRLEVACNVGTQDLESNEAIEPRILSALHFAHAAGPERSLNFIRPEKDAWG